MGENLRANGGFGGLRRRICGGARYRSAQHNMGEPFWPLPFGMCRLYRRRLVGVARGRSSRRRGACRTLPCPATNDLWCVMAFHVGVFAARRSCRCVLSLLSVTSRWHMCCPVFSTGEDPDFAPSLSTSFVFLRVRCCCMCLFYVSLIFHRPSYVVFLRMLLLCESWSRAPRRRYFDEDDARQPSDCCPGENSLVS